MGKVFEGIDAKLQAWVARQHMFFVGTAPSGADGHVNISPKGPIGSLRILDEHTVAYLDLVGSGAETIAHLRDNGRIVIMLCAFQGGPRIVRFHGTGSILAPDALEFPDVETRPEQERTIVKVDVDRISTSCGYTVPLMSYEGERPQMAAWVDNRLAQDPDALEAYKVEKNSFSIDGLPALSS